MEITSWNIQAALGVDGRVDVPRIADTLKAFGHSDIYCLQEVTRLEHKGTCSGLSEELQQQFPDYEMVFGPAVNRQDKNHRYQFGNMILSRVAVDAVFTHRLPQPADTTTRNMARQAIEILVPYNGRSLRVITTHLEYFATRQREAQLQYLGEYHRECLDRYARPSPTGEGSYVAPPEADLTIVCGDFNMESGTEHYLNFLKNGVYDAWDIAHQGAVHAPTCGIYDNVQWPNGEHTRDFFFVSEVLGQYVQNVSVDTDTQASDHQPVKLVLR